MAAGTHTNARAVKEAEQPAAAGEDQTREAAATAGEDHRQRQQRTPGNAEREAAAAGFGAKK